MALVKVQKGQDTGAGLWNTRIDKATGGVHESYTMLTINADAHPLMSRRHKPDPKLVPDQQGKRSVISIEADDVDRWLLGAADQVTDLLRPPRWIYSMQGRWAVRRGR